jgi:hypothetical protein
MPTIVCVECGAVSPKRSMDDLVEMGWQRAKGEIDGKPYDVSMCPLDSSISHFSQVLIKKITELQKKD